MVILPILQNMSVKKVTISIPIYKCEDFIINTLRSVLHQTYNHIEVLLVNDLTPDSSAVLVEQFIKENTLYNWRLIHLETNSGLSVVRNKGIDEATGDYIFFLDSDDTLEPTAIADFVKVAEKTKAQMVVGEVRGIKLPEQEEVDVFPLNVSTDEMIGNYNVLKCLVEGGFPVSSWNKLIKLDFLRNNQLYFTKGLFAQDALQTFEMALRLEHIAFLRKKTYNYFLHSNSVIHNRKKVHFDNWITIAKQLHYYFTKEQDPERKQLIFKYLLSFKVLTLQMNWKAQKNEALWKHSYEAYRELKIMSLMDYFSSKLTKEEKKANLLISLPKNIGYRIFRKRYGD